MSCAWCGSPTLDARRLGAKLRETARLMVGQPDYESYVAHRRERHPDEPVMTREAFFLERQASRFGESGRRAFRCC